MPAEAKRSSAANRDGSAGRGSVFGRRSAATRASSRNSDGSGAPSRGRLGVLALAATAFAMLVFLAASAFASKEVIDYFGVPFDNNPNTNIGGEFNNPRDIAVNRTGAGLADQGDIYVADDNNNRIQRFDRNGNFISAWGANVLTAPVNEVQTVTVNATAGTYRLTFGGATTASIAFNATASAVQTALRALSTVGGAGNTNVSVSGTAPYTVTFANGLSATNVPQLAADDTLLTGTANPATTTQGSGQYEICTVAANCRAGVASGGANAGNNAKNGSLDNPQSVAVDGDTGDVYVSDRDNFRVNQYTGDGTFIRSFGFGVDATVAGDTYEVCPVANRCQFGLAGAGDGQIGATTTAGTLGIAVSQPDTVAATGTVFLADSQNRRVNTYALDGTSPSRFGSSANFGTVNPRKIAVDSRGIVYASDSNSANQIDRYDTQGVNGPVGFLASIASPPLLAGPASTATSGLAVDPDSDGLGADEDVLYVLRDPSSGNTVVQQFGPTNDPGLAVAPAAVDDTHGAGAGFTTVQGLGLDDVSGRLLVSATSNVSGTGSGHRVYILDDSVAPGTTLDPVTVFDAHSATFTGTVDPNNAQTAYRFEYVDDTQFQADGNTFVSAEQVPIADVNVGNGDDPIAVEQQTPDDLIPGTLYHVQLVARQVFSATETIGGPLTFTTDSSAPSFHTDATGIGTDEATLRAAVNPENSAVSDYHFNWGTSDSYGNTTTPGNLPSGSAPVAISEDLTGLTPGTTYHYQLVATNGTGPTTGPDETFTTPAAPTQFPGRGYEIASWYPTGGIPYYPGNFLTQSSESGDEFIFGSAISPIPGSEIPVPVDQQAGESYPRYGSKRGPGSWQVFEYGLGSTTWIPGGGGVSRDGSRYVTAFTGDATGGPRYPKMDPDDQNGTNVLDVYQRQPDGTLLWISRDPRIPIGTPQTDPGSARTADGTATKTMSVDGGTVVFRSERQLSDADLTLGNADRLYKWDEGQLSFIGVRPDGSVPQQGSLLGTTINPQSPYDYMVSRQGDRVVWSAERTDGAGRTLYVQQDGAPTVEAVKETGVGELPSPQPYNVTYRGAAADGSRVFFTSASRLTPDSGAGAARGGAADLYVYDLAANKVRDLTPRLDGINDPTVEPATADRGRVLDVAGNSDDGRTVYFVAEAKYDTPPNPEGQLPTASARNLYMATLDGIDDPIELRFVATLGEGLGSLDGRAVFSSPDGSVLGFGSRENLVSGKTAGGTSQVYVYDAGAGNLDCASCPADGTLPAGNVNEITFDGTSQQWQPYRNYSIKHWVSSDGTVLFHTPTALLPEDENIDDDVYEYRAGELRLVSTGKSTRPSKFEDASLDGSTVFFTTLDALVPQDKEPGVPKLYAARVGGGFPFTPEQPGCDFNAGACEGAGTKAPDLPGAGSRAFVGPPNPPPNRCGAFNKRAKRKLGVAKRAAKRDQAKRARVLRGQARSLNRRAKRCHRRVSR